MLMFTKLVNNKDWIQTQSHMGWKYQPLNCRHVLPIPDPNVVLCFGRTSNFRGSYFYISAYWLLKHRRFFLVWLICQLGANTSSSWRIIRIFLFLTNENSLVSCSSWTARSEANESINTYTTPVASKSCAKLSQNAKIM